MSATQPDSAAFLALNLDSEAVLKRFVQADGWQTRYREIMLLGKQLPKLDESLKVASAQVKGCESTVWLYHRQIDQQHYFVADSDARIVKGLIALLLIACHGKTAEQIQAFDLNQFFETLGLAGQLSPSRTNGLLAVAQTIQSVAI
ncbi:SufE family protein [Shewanella waksmanii]|uniref:SufE family protein n=1 Tax=Shewanella waksmanii TaxID=213783 RepID=UPI000491C710|nr:SufE family protein [Shewanella waksmanii]